MKPIRLPVRADDPPHILLWPADEIVPIMGGLVFGMVVGQAFLFTLAGMGLARLYRRFRDTHADGYLEHLAYHFGFGTNRAPSMTNPFIKRFFP